MHIITKARLAEFWTKYADAETSLRLWYDRTRLAEWKDFVELRQIFPSADQVGNLTVFNIGGNKYRLIARVNYVRGKVFIRNVLTHAEYNTETWKNDPWFEES
jgi:mRNA interferase HigB